MTRVPVLPTVLVAAAVAGMIGLGFWQLHRLKWKQSLLHRFEVAQTLPPTALPLVPDPAQPLLFRRVSAFCTRVTGWRSLSGANRSGDPGWIHIASCSRGAEGPGFQAVMGWSRERGQPGWRGGKVSGVIAPDREFMIRLVSSEPAPGLQAARGPEIADIPNNHLAYAVQWFLFAGVAMVIYLLALRKRSR